MLVVHGLSCVGFVCCCLWLFVVACRVLCDVIVACVVLDMCCSLIVVGWLVVCP